jgi:hypothetical protein
MKTRTIFAFIAGLLLFTLPANSQPIQLHPENPHYLQYKGKPTVLITSAEHYGALLNLDFDYVTYFKEMQETGMNLTRIFSGAYCEPVGAFKIENNTLAPRWNKFICPWARSDTSGYPNGGNKFNLNKWDDAYFARLKDFMREAGNHGVIVEYVFYCPFYKDAMWELSPMNHVNNVNGYTDVKRTEVYALKDDRITKTQKAMVRKVVNELKEFDNLYYEICNEPYFGGVTLEWQSEIAQTIVDTEKEFEHRHLIAQNIANGSKELEAPIKHIDIYNYHYAFPPNAVYQNYDLNKVIGYDESGFKGISDTTYRSHAWAFLMGGGAIFNNLDYSFTPDYENGTAKVDAPGGGSAALRDQLRILREFMESLDFINMQPAQSVIQDVKGDKDSKAWCLANPGQQYAFYILHGKKSDLVLNLPVGNYQAEWIHTLTGKTIQKETKNHEGGMFTLSSPYYIDDIALKLTKTK